MVRGEVEWKCVEVGEVEMVRWRRRWWKVGEENGKKRKERKRKKEKGKEIGIREDISLGRENENNESGGFPGFGCGCGNLSGKIQESSEIQVSRNDSK